MKSLFLIPSWIILITRRSSATAKTVVIQLFFLTSKNMRFSFAKNYGFCLTFFESLRYWKINAHRQRWFDEYRWISLGSSHSQKRRTSLRRITDHPQTSLDGWTLFWWVFYKYLNIWGNLKKTSFQSQVNWPIFSYVIFFQKPWKHVIWTLKKRDKIGARRVMARHTLF